MQPEIVIIADDLTGAADTGILFSDMYSAVAMIGHDHIHKACSHFKKTDKCVLSIHTNSRSLSKEDAYSRLYSAALITHEMHPKHTYKKIDSALRGNLGAEIEATMEGMGISLSFIAPAFPEMGRTTLNDVHFIDGVSIADTGFADDPVNPMRSSCLSENISRQCKWKTFHCDISVLESDRHLLKNTIDRLRKDGFRHFTFDATSQTHLDTIVYLSTQFTPGEVLLAGSAGLAASLSETLTKVTAKPHKSITDCAKTSLKGYFLLVIGSASTVAEEQIEALSKTNQYEILTLSPEILCDPEQHGKLDLMLESLPDMRKDRNLIIKLDKLDKNNFSHSTAFAQKLITALGSFTRNTISNSHPSLLYLSGGDTAQAVLNSIGAWGLLLRQEISTGMVLGTALGDDYSNLPVITKAGTFGKETSLLVLHKYWSESNKGA